MLNMSFVGLGTFERVWFFAIVWLGCDLVVLGIAHTCGAHRVFGKRPDGLVALWGWFVFLPLLLGTHAIWHIVRMAIREPAYNVVSENLVIGRRLLPFEVDEEFANYVDLTAEFAEPRAVRRLPAYTCFPILDGSAPTPSALGGFVSSLRPGKTFVHCAQGHGRAGLFALAVLLKSGAARTAEEGLVKLRSVRPRVGLTAAQRQCIEQYANYLRLEESLSDSNLQPAVVGKIK